MADLWMAQSEDELLDAAERSATRVFQAASGLLLRERLRLTAANKRFGRVFDLMTTTLVGEEPK